MKLISDMISSVKEEQERISLALVEGHVINFETYQRLVGQHQGLEKSLDILNNLLKEDEDDR
jgi:hypothetical protein